MGKKKPPAVIYLEISRTSQSKRLEGLDILARLIVRNIMAERPPPPKEDKKLVLDH